jgi:hypothetical protein
MSQMAYHLKDSIKDYQQMTKDLQNGHINSGAGLTVDIRLGASREVEYSVEIPVEDIQEFMDYILHYKKEELKRYKYWVEKEYQEAEEVLKKIEEELPDV